jgi:hypothetical protein
LHSTRAAPNKRMSLAAAACQIRLACDQAANTDSGCLAAAPTEKRPEVLQVRRWSPKESVTIPPRDL